MISTFKLVKIKFQNFIFKNPVLLRPLTCSRNLCSKDENHENLKGDSSVNKEEKLENVESTIKSEIQSKHEASTNQSKDAAKQKLMSLLSEIKISSSEPSKFNLNLTKAIKRPTKKERLEFMKASEVSAEDRLNMAVKAVASTFKEESEKIESELTEKLNSLNGAEVPSDISKEDMFDSEMNQNLMSSVKEVADTIEESSIPTRSELTQRLLRLSLNKKDSSETRKSLKSLIEDMKVDSSSQMSLKRRISEPKYEIPPKPQGIEKVNLFSYPPLNIFSSDVVTKPDSTNLVWQRLQERELRNMTQFAPTNAFEEMIMWTEQGKHWKFPIDNETEMGAEENVGFHEHVFLEHHLKGFPNKGPIRHFMELVVVALSKNPYITVERKIENIEWFRNYFKEKEEILKDYGAI